MVDASPILIAANLYLEIDIIAHSTTIRKLLTSPFGSKQPFNFIVHRIGRTLLIDDAGSLVTTREESQQMQHFWSLVREQVRPLVPPASLHRHLTAKVKITGQSPGLLPAVPGLDSSQLNVSQFLLLK